MFTGEVGGYFAYNRANKQGRFDPEGTHTVMQALWGPMKQPRVVRIQDHELVQIDWEGLPTEGPTRDILRRMWPEDQFCTVALISTPDRSAEGLLYPPPSPLRLRIMGAYDIVEQGGWFERATDAVVKDGEEIIRGVIVQRSNNPNLRPIDLNYPPKFNPFNPLDKVLKIAQGVRRDICNTEFQERYGVKAELKTINTAFYYLHQSNSIFREATNSEDRLTAHAKVLDAAIHLFVDGPVNSFPLPPIPSQRISQVRRMSQTKNRDGIAREVGRDNKQGYREAYQEVLELIAMLIDMDSNKLSKLAMWRPRDIIDEWDAGVIKLTDSQIAVFSAQIL